MEIDVLGTTENWLKFKKLMRGVELKSKKVF